jgi:transposase
MQGKQQLEVPLFVSGDLDKFVPGTHRLRRIAKVLNFEFIREITRPFYCEDNGRTSVDPVVFFKMQILKYLYGIPSDRQLCDEIHVNMAYRWFLNFSFEDRIPDHSSLTKIRKRLGEEVFQQVFEKIVRQCNKSGLIAGKQMLSDATLIAADAATDSIELRPDKNNKAPSVAPERVSMDTHVSTTDPESTLVGRPGVPKRLYYKGHFSIDGGRSRIITDCHVTTCAAHECKILPERVNFQLKKFKLRPIEWLADGGYGHGPTYEFFRKKGIRTYIPLRDEKLGRGKHSPTAGFRYNRKDDVYVCPKGHKMYPHKPTTSVTRYRITGGECQSCPLRESCLKGNEGGKGKRIQRSHYQDIFDSIHRRRLTKNFILNRRQRSWKMEGIFAETKGNHGLDRAHYRGRSNVQIQVYLIATVYNLKRLAQRVGSALFSHLIAIVAGDARNLASLRICKLIATV